MGGKPPTQTQFSNSPGYRREDPLRLPELREPPPELPREELRLPPPRDDPPDLAAELPREPLLFFTDPELRPVDLLDPVDLLELLFLRGATVPLLRLDPLRLRLSTLPLRERPVEPRLVWLRVPEEFQTRVLRLRGWTDLVAVVPRLRLLPTPELLVPEPAPELRLLPTVVGVPALPRLLPRLLPPSPPTRVVPLKSPTRPASRFTGTSPACRPSPAAV